MVGCLVLACSHKARGALTVALGLTREEAGEKSETASGKAATRFQDSAQHNAELESGHKNGPDTASNKATYARTAHNTEATTMSMSAPNNSWIARTPSFFSLMSFS